MSYGSHKWTAFIVYANFEEQKKIIKKLKPVIRKFKHFNYNYYSEPFSPPHVSIRVHGSINEKKKLKKELDKFDYHYEVKYYDAIVRKAYEFGSRCAFLFDDFKEYFFEDDILDRKTFLFHGLHGLLDSIGIGEKEEGRIHLKLAWHFLIKKPFYRFKRRLFGRRKNTIYKLLGLHHEEIGEIFEQIKILAKSAIESQEQLKDIVGLTQRVAEGEQTAYGQLIEINEKVEKLQKQIDTIKKKR